MKAAGSGVTKPLIVAHRGASALAPENTLVAFAKAVEDGAEGLEFDVRLAKDAVPVVIHDEVLSRVASMEKAVADLTSIELQSIDVGSWFNLKNPQRSNAAFSAETVPTLARTLDFLREFAGRLYIELKCEIGDVRPLVEAVCREIDRFALFPQAIIKSFRLDAVAEIRRLCPEAKTAALFAPKFGNIFRKEKRILNAAKDLGADQISLHYSLATRRLTDKARENDFPITIWTVDNPLWVGRAAKLGIGALITNDPRRLLEKRREIFPEA